MRKFLFLPLLALLASCGKDEDYDRSNPKPEEMVTPALYATIQQNTTDLYNGPLEVLPCRPDGSIYVGNYTSTGNQTPVPAYYSIENGIGKSKNSPLRLPAGTYNIIYWGYPTFFNTTDAALSDPTLILGEKSLDTSLGLRKVPVDTVYYPVIFVRVGILHASYLRRSFFSDIRSIMLCPVMQLFALLRKMNQLFMKIKIVKRYKRIKADIPT